MDRQIICLTAEGDQVQPPALLTDHSTAQTDQGLKACKQNNYPSEDPDIKATFPANIFPADDDMAVRKTS